MNILLKRILFTVCCFLLLSVSVAQQKFISTVSPAQINKDEYVTLRMIIENANDIQRIDPPSLKNFTIVSGPNQESGMSTVNGAVTQYIAVSYVLQPRRSGKFLIDGATAVIGGKKYKSNPSQLLVKNAVSGNNPSANQSPLNPFAMMDQEDEPNKIDFKDYVLHPGENVEEKVSKNMQLRLQTDKVTCYVGEPIVATYKLYTRLKSESKLSKNPSFNGFSVVDMQQQDITPYAKEKLNGRDYNVYTIRKAQLYPLQSGEIELETAELDNSIEFLKNEANGPDNARDLLSGMRISPDALVTQNVSLRSKPVMITVKPLPEAGKPASFKGAVGHFTIEAALAKNNFSTDETGTLAIRISGSGNLQLVTTPDIAWPDGIDAFDPKLTDNISKATVPVSGNKVFVFSFAVQKEGEYKVPAIPFSYFDPQTGTYKKDSTKPLSFTVTRGTGKPVYDISNEPKKEEISLLNQIFHHRWWIIVFVALLIFTCLFYWLKNENKKEKAAIAKLAAEEEKMKAMLETAAQNQKNPLEETQACLYREDCAEFYAVLNKEMKVFIANKFDLNILQVNSKTIAAAMDRSGVENATVLSLQQLMQEIEWQVYTPFVQNEKRDELYNRAQELISQMAMRS